MILKNSYTQKQSLYDSKLIRAVTAIQAKKMQQLVNKESREVV